ncbi:MAG TPA: hypothetical protein VGE29_15220, partial [Prosthecobacter sp.]
MNHDGTADSEPFSRLVAFYLPNTARQGLVALAGFFVLIIMPESQHQQSDDDYLADIEQYIRSRQDSEAVPSPNSDGRP